MPAFGLSPLETARNMILFQYSIRDAHKTVKSSRAFTANLSILY